MSNKITPTSNEYKMTKDDFIISKTDINSHITYCNRRFIEMSGYSEAELLGKPHNIIRHPDMPMAVYQLMWQTIKSKNEFFGVVKNLCKNGSFYWTFANVTPSFDDNGRLIGYHSVRRQPKQGLIKIVAPIYQKMIAEEAKFATNKEQAMKASGKILIDTCEKLGLSYNEAIYTSI